MYYQPVYPYAHYVAERSFLSMLDIIEQRIEYHMMEEALIMYKHAIQEFLNSKNTTLPHSEYQALEKILHRFPRILKTPWRLSPAICLARLKFLSVSLEKERKKVSESRFLILDHKIKDIQSIQQEIRNQEGLWSYTISRQTNITHHRQTNYITLYNTLSYPFTSHIDTAHYAHVQPFLQAMPHLSQWIESFVEKKQGQLGRVALVRLKPNSVVFRHYDGEQILKGFDRYHVVIDSVQGSLMSVGEEEKTFKEGDVFFFENKVTHTAYNFSNQWRTHLIVDIRVPQQYCRSAPVYSYKDWKFFDPRNHQELAHYVINKKK